MPIHIEQFKPEHVPEVKRFNTRLSAGGAPAEYTFFENPVPLWLPKTETAPVYNEFFLALDDTGAVRGTYALKHQPFWVAGEERDVGFYHHPFSEGIVSRTHSMVGALLLNDVLKRQPLTYCLGMGGYDRPLPKMLIAMKWEHFAVPFAFRVIRPFRFLRGMRGLRSDARKRLLMDAAAFSGTGWAGIHALQLSKSRAAGGCTAERVSDFGEWADDVWRSCREAYPLIAVRDRRMLNVLFPASNTRFTRIRLADGRGVFGWAVVSVRQYVGHEQYGDLRVGHIVDCLAPPVDAVRVIKAACSAAADLGADIAVCNHSHDTWAAAMTQAGMLSGPSNFILAVPKGLSTRLQPFESVRRELYFTRADGDGLYQYLGTR